MKKLITITCCFAFIVGVMTGCRRTEDNRKNDASTTPTTTMTSTNSTVPSSVETEPSTIPDSGFMPNDNENNGNGNVNPETNNGNTGIDGNMNKDTQRSRAYPPSSNGSIR